jgi:hypothetical protein
VFFREAWDPSKAFFQVYEMKREELRSCEVAEVLQCLKAMSHQSGVFRPGEMFQQKHGGAGVEALTQRFSDIDRRSGMDRRKAHKLEYFLNGGVERRNFKERRSSKERREGWVRVSDWCSVRLDSLRAGKVPKRLSGLTREKE